MLCKKCNGRQIEVNLPGIESLCGNCFCRQIEWRIRKRIRLSKAFKKGDRILIFDKLSLYLVKKIIKGLPVEIFFKPQFINAIINNRKDKKLEGFKTANNINKVVVPWTLDNEICSFFGIFLERKIKNDYIKFLANVREEEIILFAKFKNLNFISIKVNEKLSKLIDGLEKKYPDLKFGLGKSMKRLMETKR